MVAALPPESEGSALQGVLSLRSYVHCTKQSFSSRSSLVVVCRIFSLVAAISKAIQSTLAAATATTTALFAPTPNLYFCVSYSSLPLPRPRPLLLLLLLLVFGQKPSLCQRTLLPGRALLTVSPVSIRVVDFSATANISLHWHLAGSSFGLLGFRVSQPTFPLTFAFGIAGSSTLAFVKGLGFFNQHLLSGL